MKSQEDYTPEKRAEVNKRHNARMILEIGVNIGLITSFDHAPPHVGGEDAYMIHFPGQMLPVKKTVLEIHTAFRELFERL